jgi:hypothetical protein
MLLFSASTFAQYERGVEQGLEVGDVLTLTQDLPTVLITEHGKPKITTVHECFTDRRFLPRLLNGYTNQCDVSNHSGFVCRFIVLNTIMEHHADPASLFLKE